MSKLDKDTVIANFTKAYEKTHGKTPSIDAKGGWYSVDGGKNMRLAQLEELTSELMGSSEAAPPSIASEPSKKKPAKKASAKKAKSTFSVKEFYTQQILTVNPGSRAPR